MREDAKKDTDFESYFDINKVPFENVSREFENRFRKRYESSLNMMADNRGRLTNASGANTLGILEKMAQELPRYNKDDVFEEKFNALEEEHQAFPESH